MTTSPDEALAEMLRQRIENLNLTDVPNIYEFVRSARRGSYRSSNPIRPEAIGLTMEEFIAIRALVYGESHVQ